MTWVEGRCSTPDHPPAPRCPFILERTFWEGASTQMLSPGVALGGPSLGQKGIRFGDQLELELRVQGFGAGLSELRLSFEPLGFLPPSCRRLHRAAAGVGGAPLSCQGEGAVQVEASLPLLQEGGYSAATWKMHGPLGRNKHPSVLPRREGSLGLNSEALRPCHGCLPLPSF